jgi:hypothetical protein
LAAALSFLPVALLVREHIESRAFSVALHAVRLLGIWVKEPPVPPADEGEFLPLLPPLGEASQSQPGQARATPRAPRGLRRGDQNPRTHQKWVAPPILPLPVSQHVSDEQVLGWASARVMPAGRTREAGFGLPAGIELSSVSGLGIGLLDGDRLVAVGGVPVTQRAQVVSLVLAARGRHEPQLVASLWRRTALGPRAFSVVVEQPYPAGADERPASKVPNSTVPGISSASTRSASPH